VGRGVVIASSTSSRDAVAKLSRQSLRTIANTQTRMMYLSLCYAVCCFKFVRGRGVGSGTQNAPCLPVGSTATLDEK
jgi:hypothetical protein